MMKKIKMNQEVEISRQQAEGLIGNDYDFRNIISGMSIETQDENCNFPVVQNVSFSIEKIKRAGTIVPDYQNWKCKEGQFVIKINYDYIHPSNFAQNSYNIVKKFHYAS